MLKALITQLEGNDRRIFWILVFVFATVLSSYVYFLGSSVYSVIVRKESERESGQLAAKISILESRYVELDKAVSLELAHASGFVDITVPRYISRENNGETFTLRTESVSR